MLVTENEFKVAEIRAVLGDEVELEHRRVELLEPQGTQEQIARFKAREAYRRLRRPVLVEDTGLYLDCCGGMPGPYIKCFTKAMTVPGVARLAQALGDDGAMVRTTIAVHLGGTGKAEKLHLFTAELRGRIVEARGTPASEIAAQDWNVIFLPEGREGTLAEMDAEARQAISPRTAALHQMLEHLRGLRAAQQEPSTAASAPDLFNASTVAQDGDHARGPAPPVLSMQDLDCARPLNPQ